MMDLEDLLTKAMAKQTPQKERRRKDSPITVKELAQAERRLRERFMAAENWERMGTVALVHEGTETLLGNFTEYKHRLVVGTVCRRLVRVSEPTVVDKIEHVKGDHWINAQPLSEPDEKPDGAVAEEVRDAIADLHLPEMDNVFAPEVLVSVVLHWGSVARVELSQDTRFYSKDKRIQIILPEGLDVREGLSLETKLRLKEFLGL